MASDDIPAPDFSPHFGRDSGRGHNSRGEGMRGSPSGHLSSPQNSSRGSDPSGDNTVPHWFLEYESRSRNTGRTVPIPSNLCFSGGKNDNFANFESRLDKFLNVHKIMDHDMILFYLSNMFRDKASLFFEDLVHRNPRFGFNSLMDALRKRFGDNRLDQAAILEFNAAEQYDGEDVRDYAQRLWSLGGRAHPRVGYDELERIVTVRFGMGIHDTGARMHVLQQGCTSVDDAMHVYTLYENARSPRGLSHRNYDCSQAYDNSSSPSVRQSRIDSVRAGQSEEVSVTSEIGRLFEFVKKFESKIINRLDDLDRRVEAIEKDVKKIRSPAPILKSPSSLERRESSISPNRNSSYRSSRPVSRNQSRSPGRSQSGDRRCFTCDSESHLARDCPMKRDRSARSMSGERTCFNCQEEGHIARDCPHKKAVRYSDVGNGIGK